ncbi:MAG: ATP-binding protein [Planctomycetota bacterium]
MAASLSSPTSAAGPTPPGGSDASRLAINAAWLVRLRWVAAAGQVLTIGVVEWGLGVAAPAWPLFAMVGVTVGTNAAFHGWVRRCQELPCSPSPRAWHAVLGGLMLLDLLVLSAMLSLTGGPTNPFAVFYFVNLALCGVLLPARWAWLLCAITVLAFAVISYRHLPLDELRDPRRLESIAVLGGPHVVTLGAMAAFAACSGVIVSFATRLTKELELEHQARTEAEERRARSEKLEALGTLAAGAAHELATPLGTIAVVAGELDRTLTQAGVGGDAADDVRLIREELARCRRILDRMSTGAAQPSGEAPDTFSLEALVEHTLAELPPANRVSVKWSGDAAATKQAQVHAPRTALAQALRAVVQNAVEVTAADSVVVLSAEKTNEHAVLEIVDEGAGMLPDVLARAGEPFFTTKPAGHGMGLGLYLARSVVEQIGGELAIRSHAGAGTTVSVTLRTVAAHQSPARVTAR